MAGRGRRCGPRTRAQAEYRFHPHRRPPLPGISRRRQPPHPDPNLDRLAARGVHFRNAVASTPQCAPNRGVLLSGPETCQNGLRSNGATRFREGVAPTAIEQLRRSGFDTVIVAARGFKSALRAEHPRLIALDADIAALNRLVRTAAARCEQESQDDSAHG